MLELPAVNGQKPEYSISQVLVLKTGLLTMVVTQL
jgi:hypothetical protein